MVTDRNQCKGRTLEDVVAAALDGGVNLVQVREKDLPARELFDLATRIREITMGRALLFVNDRIDVALACGADGVQLGEEGLPLDAARRVCGDTLLLGRSVHSVDSAVRAESEGADFLILGTIFPTGSHPGATTGGVELIGKVRERVELPFLAIGGVTANNVASVIEAGASGAAVITAISHSPDPGLAAKALLDRINATSVYPKNSEVGGVARPA